MKRSRANLAIISALILLGSLPPPVHGGDNYSQNKQVALPQSENHSEIKIRLFQYQPGRMQVAQGTTIIWVNEDDIFHSVTADKQASGFAAALDGKGTSFSFTFHQPGVYSYHCERHEHMRGEIEVK